MKYGVLFYQNSKNIGDDIQSYAAAQFLPRIDCFVDREHLSLFRSELGERIAVIMNGWYFIRKFNWPPSPDLIPFYTSIHFNQEDYFGINDTYLDGLGGEALRSFAPIGCRDNDSLALLEEKGIAAYYSGCLTLTLPRTFEAKPGEVYACLTNVSDEVYSFVKTACPGLELRQISHEPAIVENATMQERFANVETLLSQYQNAKFVITTRLHCALPCLALGTPVLLLSEHHVYEKSRFSGTSSLLYRCTEDEFLRGESAFTLPDPPENNTAYQELRTKLSTECRAFVQRCEMGDYPPPFIVDSLAAQNWVSSLLEAAQDRVNQRFAALYEYLTELETAKTWLEAHSNRQACEITRLNEILAEKDACLAQLQQGKDWLEKHSDEQETWIAHLNEEIAKKDALLTVAENAHENKEV